MMKLESHSLHFFYYIMSVLLFRWRLYRFLVKNFQSVIGKMMKELQTMYTDIVKLGDELRYV